MDTGKISQDTKKSVQAWKITISKCLSVQSQLLAVLSDEEKARFNAFRHEKSAAAFLCGRAALRILLATKLNVKPNEIAFSLQEHGKPVLCENMNLQFNISHSHDLLLLAVSTELVGIDVEYVNRKIDIAAIMRRFFSKSEMANHAKYSLPNSREAFFRGWTRKEAFLKATGEGIAGLAELEIDFNPESKYVVRRCKGNDGTPEQWQFHDFIPVPDYIASVAVKSQQISFELNDFSFPQYL